MRLQNGRTKPCCTEAMQTADFGIAMLLLLLLVSLWPLCVARLGGKSKKGTKTTNMKAT